LIEPDGRFRKRPVRPGLQQQAYLMPYQWVVVKFNVSNDGVFFGIPIAHGEDEEHRRVTGKSEEPGDRASQ